ncbi:MAG: hypothetical protein ACTSVO_05690 [Candidatus Heimdallarchaeaceae archaeon]
MDKKLEGDEVRCTKCGWVWLPRFKNPKMCANQKCRSPYWNVPRDEEGNIRRNDNVK